MMMNEEGARASNNSYGQYDIFVSFSGDTRFTFTGTLYNALRQKRFKIFFMDKDKKDEGEATLKAIQKSKTFIVILSQQYVSSSLCLDELVNITKCMMEKKKKKKKNQLQLLFPVFYELKPSDIRYYLLRSSSYVQAFPPHHHHKLKEWKSALIHVTDMNGWIHGSSGYEYELIQKIVQSAVETLQRYDIFLSFAGEDTRYSFTGFLYNALRSEGFKTFMDDEGLVGGTQISQTLIEAIERSRLSIIVFSENYGYSTWCLDELAKIIECMKTKNQLVWPLFYKVEQSDISNQTGSYGEAIAAHEKRFGKDSEKVLKWRSALSEVANLEGWHFKIGYEYEFIQKIVEKAIEMENQL